MTPRSSPWYPYKPFQLHVSETTCTFEPCLPSQQESPHQVHPNQDWLDYHLVGGTPRFWHRRPRALESSSLSHGQMTSYQDGRSWLVYGRLASTTLRLWALHNSTRLDSEAKAA